MWVPAQNKTIYSPGLICEGISRYCFPQRKFVKIRLTGTAGYLLQTPVINYEFNNHLSSMFCVINCSPASASCNLFSGQEVWALQHYTADNALNSSLLPYITPSLPSHLISELQGRLYITPGEGGAVSCDVNLSQLSTYRIYLTARDGLSVNTNLPARIY